MRRILSSERAADLLLWFVISVPVVLADDPPPGVRLPAGIAPLWIKVASILLLGLAVAVSRRHPVVAAAVPAVLMLTANPALTEEDFTIAQVLLAFLLGRRTSRTRTGLLFFGGVGVAGLALVWLAPGFTPSRWLEFVAGLLLVIMLPWLAGRSVRQHDQLVRAGWELAERLEREQDLIGERTRLLERSRIAGDMHDSLGHELSLVALRAAALQVEPGLDGPARDAAGVLRESAARATERLREIIGVLRADGEPAPVLPSGDTVTALIERASASGMAVTLEGELPSLPPMADRAAYRVVQEGLTNATKHAPGAAVTVRLETDAAQGEAVVTVTNVAPRAGSRSGLGSGGHGLVGLDERVRLAGGRLSARPIDGGGFEIAARLPLIARGTTSPSEALARSKVRRSVIDAIWVPLAAAAALLVLMFGYDRYTSQRSVLDAEVYRELRIGDARSSVQSRLPPFQADSDQRPAGAPADPPGTGECRYYRIREQYLSPAYRLCFTDGRLSHKDIVTLAPNT